MPLYRSKPQIIEAVQWLGGLMGSEIAEFGGDKVRWNQSRASLELLAGKDGQQGWVPVPVGHWLVNLPGDKSDIWPVDPKYFAGKYEEAG